MNKSFFIVSFIFFLFFLITESVTEPENDIFPQKRENKETLHIISPKFLDVTASARLFVEHSQKGNKLSALDETLGAGACAFDYDNDHWIDLLIISGSGQNHFYGKQQWWQQKTSYHLLRNLGNGKFQDVSQEAGLLANEWGMGCNTADLDNDGDQDVIISNKGNNKLYRNNGNGTFTDVSKAAGFTNNAWSTSISLADYDQDGYLDLYINNYIKLQKGAKTFEKMTGYHSLLATSFDASLYDAAANKLYHNMGNLQFKEVSTELGVDNLSGRSLGSHWLDINNDHYPDLWVSNDKGFPNQVYINQKGKRFEEVSEYLKVNSAERTGAIISADINNNGVLDVVLASGNHYPPVLYQSDKLSTYNSYKDKSRSLGLAATESIVAYQWGVLAQDFNHNGWLDVMSANGYTSPDMDNPRIPQGQVNSLWLNQGNGSFKPCFKSCSQAFQDTFSSRSLVSADFDNDGDIDVYITNNNEAGQLLFNQTISNKKQTVSQHWVEIGLQAKRGNKDALGVIVKIKTANKQYMRMLDSSANFLSSGSKRLHFGLGVHNNIDELSIEWSSGLIQTFSNLPVDRYIFIYENDDKYQIVDIKNPKLTKTTTTVSKKNKLLLIKESLLSGNIDSSTEKEFQKLIYDSDEIIRRNALKLASSVEYKIESLFEILINALSDSDESIRLLAVKKLKQFESEISVRYLLRLFNDKDYKVRCAVINTFSFFFREEEAVLNKKYLALPFLIKALNDPIPKVRQCAASSLAEAEAYRTVEPLIQHLNDPNLLAKLAIIDALGLIRQRSAVPALFELLNDSTQVEVLVHTLIALKRLNAVTEEKLLRKLLQNKSLLKNYNDLFTVFSVYEKLLSDSVVFNPRFIIKNLWDWFSEQPYEEYLDNKNLKPSFLLMLRIIRLESYKKGDVLARYFIDSSDEELKKSAYLTLIKFDKLKNYIPKNINDMPIYIRRLVYINAKEQSVSIPLNILKKDIYWSELRDPIIRLLANYSDSEAKMVLLEIAENIINPDSVRILAMKSLSTNIMPTMSLPLSLYQDDNVSIRKLAMVYFLNQLKKNPFIALAPDEIKLLLANDNLEFRDFILIFLAGRSEVWATNIWKKYLYNKETPLSLKIKILENLDKKTLDKEKKNILTILHNNNGILSNKLFEFLINN